jgi:hypothetical protein
MKTPYSYSILRYIHDIVSGEFINVGVVMFAPKAKFLSAMCTPKYGRISKMFTNLNGEHFKQVSRYIQAKLDEEGERLISELQFNNTPKSVLDFTKRVLPVDDSSLQFSPESYGLSEKPQETLELLFNRYVEKYYEKSEHHSRSDEDIWKIYKKPLEEKRILANLIPHQIIGKDYEHEFDYCWKNKQWHISEPISFDMSDSGYISDKANIWLGRITNLVDGGEKFKLTILIGSPRDERLKSSFVKAQNILNRMSCEHAFVLEGQASEYAENLKKEIEAHKVAA